MGIGGSTDEKEKKGKKERKEKRAEKESKSDRPAERKQEVRTGKMDSNSRKPGWID